ncbi:7TM diverse intracellular signaling domain-containing protein [Flavobacterium sp.]|uniref:sensor histidine kinase n=1 Tax=Flavobacterium sp. TaxID=239 RepID=UPI0012141CFB|nr:7TM diverse intracellular signaling domain-containing protein [Flavobacterium sp.]RZJ71028.1 MAG: hypothetical protein EOO49_11265 [Flavobacterium sp.]
MHELKIDLALSLFILGATVLALVYHVVLYVFGRDKLLVHYLIYLFFTSVFLFSYSGLGAFFFGYDNHVFYLTNFRELIQIVYLTAYFNFIVEAVGISRKSDVFLFRNWKFIAALLILYGIGYTILTLFFPSEMLGTAFTLSRIFIFGVTGIMLYQSYRLREIKFHLIVLYGCTFYLICGLISFISNLFNYSDWPIWPIEWLMIGSFVDIIFFSLAIGYRNKKQWENLNFTLLEEANKVIALQKMMLAKQLEIENERKRIAADMHDDLGSGLTKIMYLSQMASQAPESRDNLKKIQQTATDLIGNMSELIWVMKDENNTLEDLATYIKSYAVDYLESNKIEVRVALPEDFRNAVLDGKQRRHLFLCVKEALHNVVKHSKASRVFVAVDLDSECRISISDDGVGFASGIQKNPVGRNGMQNMESRMRSISGQMQVVESHGITVIFSLPLDGNVQNEPFVPLVTRDNDLSFAPKPSA